MPRKKKPARGELFAAVLPSWDRTPFHDHASVKGAGADCKGLLKGIADELGFPEAQSIYGLDLDYSLRKRNGVPSDRLKEGFAALFDPVTDIKPGDILLLDWDGKPGHIAIFDGKRAWSSLPGSGVRARSLPALFHKFPLDSIWRWRS